MNIDSLSYTARRDINVSILTKCKFVLQEYPIQVRTYELPLSGQRKEVVHELLHMEVMSGSSQQGDVYRTCFRKDKHEFLAKKMNVSTRVLECLSFMVKIMDASVSSINEVVLGEIVFSRSGTVFNVLLEPFTLMPSRAPLMACSIIHHAFTKDVERSTRGEAILTPCVETDVDYLREGHQGKEVFVVSIQEDVSAFSHGKCRSLHDWIMRYIRDIRAVSEEDDLIERTSCFQRFLSDVLTGVCTQLTAIRRTSAPTYTHNDMHCNNILVAEHPSTITWYNKTRTNLQFTPYLIDFGLSTAEGGVSMAHDITSSVFNMHSISPATMKLHFGEDMISLLMILIDMITSNAPDAGSSRKRPRNPIRKLCFEKSILGPLKDLLASMTDGIGFQSSMTTMRCTPHLFVPRNEGEFDVIILNPELKLRHAVSPQALHIPVSCLWDRAEDGIPRFVSALRRHFELQVYQCDGRPKQDGPFYRWVMDTYVGTSEPESFYNLINYTSETGWSTCSAVMKKPLLTKLLRAAMSLRVLEIVLSGQNLSESKRIALQRIGFQQQLPDESRHVLNDQLEDLISVSETAYVLCSRFLRERFCLFSDTLVQLRH